MESSLAVAPNVRATALTRALCLLVLALMAAAAVYGAVMAIRYFSVIGV